MQSSSPSSYGNGLHSDHTMQTPAEDEESVNTSSPECSISSYRSERRKQRRNPSVLVQWIEEHPFNPYPTKQEKQQLAVMSGMTLRQLNDWFANARRNIKKLGFEIWRKKRSGIPGQRMFSHATMHIPPNVVANGELNCRLIPAQSLATVQTGSLPLGQPITNHSIPLCGPPQKMQSQQMSQQLSQPTPTYTTRLHPSALFPNGTGWAFTPNTPIFRPSVPTSCSCSMCKTNMVSGNVTTVFSSANPHTSTSGATLPLSSLPWGTVNSHTFNYLNGQRSECWNGSPMTNHVNDSCSDISLQIPLNVGGGLVVKEEVNGINETSALS